MCLDYMDAETKDWEEGYKIFESRSDGIYSAWFPSACGFEVGKWIYDKADWVTSTKFPPAMRPKEDKRYGYYRCGFHFFKNYRDAMEVAAGLNTLYEVSVCVHKIKVENLTATGRWDGREAGVAEEIFIEPESCGKFLDRQEKL